MQFHSLVKQLRRRLEVAGAGHNRRRASRNRSARRRSRFELLEDRMLLATFTVNHTPYLQLGDAELGFDTDQMEILWQTQPDEAAGDDSFDAQYRLAGSPTWIDSGAILTDPTDVEDRVNHFVVIPGLDYDSDYEYRVRHWRDAEVEAEYTDAFHTRLPAADPTAFTFVAYGDSAVDDPPDRPIDNFNDVQNRIRLLNPAFSLLLGDNVYPAGSHAQFDLRLSPTVNPDPSFYNSSHIDYYAMGNHDAVTDDGQPSLDNYSVPLNGPAADETPEKNYSFDYGNVHFLTFDSTSLNDAARLNTQLTWAEADLEASEATWKIVFVHHPVAGAPDKLGITPAGNYYKQVVPRLKAAGADLLMAGHSHLYHRTYPLLGQVGGVATFVPGENDSYVKGSGLIQVVAGTGGAGLRGGNFDSYPFQAAGFSLDTDPLVKYGFSRVDVTASELTVSYIPADTGVALDSFTLGFDDAYGPTVELIVPEDNGPEDEDPRLDVVFIDSVQPSFQIQLTDDSGPDGVDDVTVTVETVSVTKDGSPLPVDFSYNLLTDIITLTTSGGGAFGDGVYSIAVSEGEANIRDLMGNPMDPATFTVEIDTSVVIEWFVKHEPYLQLGDAALGSPTDQIEILWQIIPNVPVGIPTLDSFVVEYRQAGVDPWIDAGAISTYPTGVEGRINRSVAIPELAYDTDYEYQVTHNRAGSLLDTYGDTFHTRLAAGDSTSFSFAAYGDSATNPTPDRFREVQDRINQVDAATGIAFSLSLGDNVYGNSGAGIDDGSHRAFDARLDATVNSEAAQYIATHVDYLTLGNHDNQTNSGEPELENYSVPQNGPDGERDEKNYSFDYGNVHFLTFDSNSLNNATRLDEQLTWAEEDLTDSTATWKIVFVHHPVAGSPDKSQDPGDNYYRQVVPRLRAAGADLFLAGHSHLYHRTYPLLGAVDGVATFVPGESDSYMQGWGLIQVVAGTGGAGLRAGDFSQFPFDVVGFSTETTPAVEWGFSQIDVTPTLLTVSYIAADDGAVLDSFTIGPDMDGPTAELVVPDDNGAGDQDPALNAVLTASAPCSFKLQLADNWGPDGVNDATVTEGTVSVTRDGSPLPVRFDYDLVNDVITLNAAGGGGFGNGSYEIAVSDGAKIRDLAPGSNAMDIAIFTVEIDTSRQEVITVDFQQGVNGYTGTRDTFLDSAQATTDLGAEESWEWGYDGAIGGSAGLIRFIEIFGSGEGQIPDGATINNATLHYQVFDPGDVADVYEVAVPWDQSTITWDSFGPWPGVQAVDYRTPSVATAPATTGSLSIDVTASLQSWVVDPGLNLGWLFHPIVPTGTDTSEVRSSEYMAAAGQRPRLEVTYTTADTTGPAVTGYTVVDDTGIAGDQVTADDTPELIFDFSEAVYGVDADVTVLDPASSPVTPDSISGWDSKTLTVTFSTPLTLTGEYTVTLNGSTSIQDAAGNALNDGADQVETFTLIGVTIVDDGDPLNYASTAGFTPAAGGYGGDSQSAPAGTGTETATWTLNLTPGMMYNVAATWVTNPSLATDARYKFTDGANEWTIFRSQRRAPDDFNDAGFDWESLGTVTCTSGTLVVELSNLANGTVMADAIRAEQVGVGATFIDYGDPGYSEVGPWGGGSGLFFNQETRGINPASTGGTGASTASWTFDVDPGYEYELAANWLHFSNRATNARYALRDQVGAVVQNEWWRFVSQRNAPNEFDDQGEDWRVLDTFSMTGDTLVVELSDLANGWVLADAMRLVKLRPADVQFIDDEDPGYSETPAASWTDGNSPTVGFRDDVHYLPSGSGANLATWTATVDVGSTYEVSATWNAFSNRASNAPFEVRNGGNIWTVPMDQRQATGDFRDQGEEWFVLANVGAIDTTLEVELTDDADGYVFADAIRLLKKELGVEILQSSGSTLVSEDGLTDTYDVVLTAQPTAAVQVKLISADGQATVVDNANPGNSFLTFTAANWSTPQTVLVTAVGDCTGEGSHTERIIHRANSADGRYAGIEIDHVTAWIADNDADEQIVDNGDPDFFKTRGRGWPVANAGYDDDITFSAPSAGGWDTATWTFVVQPGYYYDVSATWIPFANRATNAPYTITDGTNTETPTANQRLAPSSFTYLGAAWETLATIGVEPGNHVLTVELTDLADGLVLADAIHISRGLPYPPPPPPVAPADLDLMAHWIAGYESALSVDDADSEESELARLDYLFKLIGSR